MSTNKRHMRSAMLIVLLASLGASRAALAVDEIEPNDPGDRAQHVDVGGDGSVVVNAAIFNTTSHRDVDFFSFEAKQNDVLKIDVGDVYPGMVPIVAVFAPNSTVPALYGTQWYPINAFHAQQDGTYIVGVSTDPSYILGLNALSSPAVKDTSPYYYEYGRYKLTISGITPSVQQISIEVKPGSKEVVVADSTSSTTRTAVRGNAKGSLPVALLSSSQFNALDVNQDSLRFGATGQEQSLVGCNGGHGTDVDHDGTLDLICHFDLSKTNFGPGVMNGVVTGKTVSGTAFEGQGFLKIISGNRPL